MSPSWHGQQQEARERLGKLILIISVGLAVLAIGIWLTEYFLTPKGGPNLVMFFVSSIAAGIGIGGILVGFAWPYLKGVPGKGGYIWGKWFHEPYLWLENVHPKLLESLPIWTGIRVQDSQAAPPSENWKKQGVLSVVISLAILIIFVIVRVTIKMMVRGAMN